MNFIKKNIKKILNKKNRKFLIVAIALIAAIAFYFYFNKENFSTKTVSSRLSKEKRNKIQLGLKAIWKNIPKGTGNEKRDKLQKCRSLLRKDIMTYDDIKYVQTSLDNLWRSSSGDQRLAYNKYKMDFDEVKLNLISAKANRKMIRDGLRSIYEASSGSRKETIKFIRDKMGKWERGRYSYDGHYVYDRVITKEGHKKIISHFKLLIRNTRDESLLLKYKKYNKIAEDSLAKLQEAEAELEEAE
jgi:hypothetical protein